MPAPKRVRRYAQSQHRGRGRGRGRGQLVRDKAIQTFLNRDLDDFTWAKELHNKDLWREIRANNAKGVLRTKPFKHQKVCYLIGINHPQFLFLLDMGLGKTLICLNIMRYHQQKNNATGKKLVLVPNLVNIDNWVEETKLHQPELSVIPLTGDTEQRRLMLQGTNADLYVLNYAGLNYLVSKKERTKGGKNKLKNDPEYTRKLFAEFDTVIFDEITDAKNHESLTFRAATQISNVCHYRYGLTGTPFGRDPQDLWAQFFLVDRGESLGPTLGIFRQAFFKEVSNGFAKEYKIDKKKALNRAMRHRSIVYDAEEAHDMPKKVMRRINVTLSPDIEGYYKRALENLKNAKGDYREMDNEFCRMRQICSGFASAKGVDDEKKVEIEFPSNPKLDALDQLLRELPANAKFVIYTEFKFSNLLVSQLLERRGIGHRRLHGGTGNKIKTVREFKSKQNVRALVANSRSADKGLNLQVATYCIFFESPASPIIRAQAEARIRRGKRIKGSAKQRKKAAAADRRFYYDLVVRNSVEETILDFHKEGKDLHKSIVRGHAKALT